MPPRLRAGTRRHTSQGAGRRRTLSLSTRCASRRRRKDEVTGSVLVMVFFQTKCFSSIVMIHADVAQLVEHVLGKDEVTGSIPVVGSITFSDRSTGRYRSGQTGQTVNLLAYAFLGSNPSLPTIHRLERPCRRSSGVEQRFCKAKVVGSIPSVGSMNYAYEIERERCGTCRRFHPHSGWLACTFSLR